MKDKLAIWLNPKRKRLLGLLAILGYALFGFYGIPAIIEHQLPKIGAEQLNRPLRIAAAEFNPFLFTLRLSGLELDDLDGTRLVSVDDVFVDFETRSVIEGAFTFADLRVDGLSLHYERFADGSSRLDQLLADIPDAEPAAASESDSLPSIIVDRIRINAGRAKFIDQVPIETYDTDIGPIDISVDQLSTLPDRIGKQSVRVVIDQTKELIWQGKIGLQPLRSSGHIRIQGDNLSRMLAYLKRTLDVHDMDANFDISLNYQIDQTDQGELQARVTDLSFVLEDYSLQGLSPARELLRFDRFALLGGQLRWPQQTIDIDSIEVVAPHTSLALMPDGELDVSALVLPTTDEPVVDESDASPPWSLDVNRIAINDAGVQFSDRTLESSADIALASIFVELDSLTLAEGAAMPLSMSADVVDGGQISAEGEVTLFGNLDLNLKVDVTDLPVALAEPYVVPVVNIDIAGGNLDASVKVNVDDEKGLSLSGGFVVEALDITNADGSGEVLGWEALRVNNFDYSSSQNTLRSSELVLDAPSGQFHIAADRSNNISDLLVSSAEEPQQQNDDQQDDQTTAAIPHITLLGLKVSNGRLDFADESLPLPFATDINSLNGRLSTLDNRSREPVRLEFAGHVSTYGMARIDGTSRLMEPLDSTDIEMEFRNIKLKEYTPYSIQFAGRKIEAGNLDITLEYLLEDAQMKGNNSLLIKDFTLGERVQYEGAMDLPLDLAVALLTRPDGSIDLALPVSGDLNEPEFDYGALIRKVLGNTLTKLVTAPFNLLGSLVGVSSENFGEFEFLPGSDELMPPEKDQAAKLAEALAQRPQITVKIEPGIDEQTDTAALKKQAFEQRVMDMLDLGVDEVRANLMVDEAFGSMLEQMYDDLKSTEERDLLKARFIRPNDDGETELDQLAYLQEVVNVLIANQPLPEDALTMLGQRRAEAIRTQLLEYGVADAAQISIDATQQTQTSGDWVITRLAAGHR